MGDGAYPGRTAGPSSQEEEACLRKDAPEESSAAWALRFVQDLPNVKMVLSGMSEMQQMVENARTFSEEKPLTYGEREKLLELAGGNEKFRSVHGLPLLLRRLSDAAGHSDAAVGLQ